MAATPSATQAPLSTSTVPIAADLPPLVVAHDAEVSLYVDGELDLIGSVEPMAALAISDGEGSVVVQSGRPPEADSALVLLMRDGDPPITRLNFTDAPQLFLHDVARIEGQPHVLFATLDERVDAEVRGELLLAGLADGAVRKIDDAFLPAHFLDHASFGGGVVAASVHCDLTECVEFLDINGDPVEGLPDPTEGLGYNQPPLITKTVLSPDASRLAYLEGPDVGAESPSQPTGEWVLVVLAQKDGSEVVRLIVAPNEEQIDHLDFDGRWAVASRLAEDGERLPAVTVDTTANDPEPIELTDVVGTATIADGDTLP